MRHIFTSLIMGGFVLVATASADQVVFKNGDRLTGKIETAADGKLTIQSQVAGKVTISLVDVQTFSTEEAIEIHLTDGTVVKRKVQTADPNRFAIESGDTIQPQALRIADIVTVNPPARPVPKWTGQISAGLTKTTGNTHTETRNLSASAVRRSENDRITLNMDYARGSQKDTVTGDKRIIEDWWRGRAKYDYFMSKQLYVYGDGRYEKDVVALLDRRMLIGAGAGYQWIETDRTKLRFEFGAASLYEKFDNVLESNSEMSLQLGYNFDRQLCKTVEFINDLTYYPSFDKFSDYYMTTSAEFRAHFTPRMFGNFKVLFNYDESPAPDRGKTDVKYIVGVGLSF
jgi:putative salt-induced outer membrane protein YdiY